VGIFCLFVVINPENVCSASRGREARNPLLRFFQQKKLTKKVPLAEIAKINLEKVTPVAGSNLLSEKVS